MLEEDPGISISNPRLPAKVANKNPRPSDSILQRTPCKQIFLFLITFAKDINRFFVSAGTAENMPDPKVEFRDQAKDDIDFEDALGDALCVFKSGGVDSDLLEQNDK